jgi:hypothetical protein
MNSIKLSLFTIILTFSLNTLAHQDHGHGFSQETNISQEQAKNVALDELINLIKNNSLPNTWNKASASDAVLTRLDNRQVWKVTFTLAANKTSGLKQLELFISKTGDLITL